MRTSNALAAAPSFSSTSTKCDLPEVFQKECFIKYFSNEWVDASDDIDHENATTIEANNRVAFKLQEYTEQGLTNIELRSAFREHFACWGDRSFKLLSTPVKTELREFLLKREVDIEKGLGIHIVNALLKVVKTQTKEEEEWIEAVRQSVGP
ncbi:hypothetical protein E4U58_002855 [Claviceps cyperi]|nr:hypothetical protein E4U58_002855 [Claviceps cyperi]